MGNIKKAAELIKNANYIIAFTGAGISVESGIPPFRGKEGLWENYDPKILDLSYFYSHPRSSWIVIKEIFYDFWGKAKPNPAHEFLSFLEKQGNLKTVITQNIDNLHQEAGSKNVCEFHGTLKKMVCTSCGALYPSEQVKLDKLPPKCKKCQGILKPDFIFFGEGISEYAYMKSMESMRETDLLIIVGTTGEVMPAASLPQIAKLKGAKIIEINTEKSSFTNSLTDIFLQGKAGEVSAELKRLLLEE